MKKDIMEIIFINDNGKKRISPLFALLSASAVFLAVIALIAGILIPKSSDTIDRRLISLRKTDKAYTEQLSAYETSRNEEEQLQKQLDEKKKEAQTLGQSQDNLDTLTQKNTELENEKAQFQEEVITKQNTLKSLDASLNAKVQSSITCPSGRYTVGENIAEGTYTITGTGSIVISSSGTAHVNKALKSDGESFTLKNGDIVKIDGNAKLVLE